MKKIKSKLVYINPSFKTSHKPDKQPSPDNKNRSKIQRTNSPVKEVEQYYSHAANYFCTQQKPKMRQKDLNQKKSNKNLSAFSLKNSYEEIDIDSLSQSIKLKSPSSRFQYSENELSSSQQQCQSKQNFITQGFNTPKNKTISFQHELPQYSSEFKSDLHKRNLNQKYTSLTVQNSSKWNRNFAYEPQSYCEFKINVKQKNQSGQVKKSKKKLQIFTSSLSPSSKEKPTKDSPLKQNQKIHPKQILPHVYQLQSEVPLRDSGGTLQQQQQKSYYNDNKEQYIQELENKLRKKDAQIQKMAIYVGQYEKLGAKNLKMEMQMGQVLAKFQQMKQNQQIAHSQARQSQQTHDQPKQNYSNQSSFNKQKIFLKSSSNRFFTQQQKPLSQIQQQNKHTDKISHRKSLTDDYIKIYEDIESVDNTCVEQEEQSYKPNMVNYLSAKQNPNDRHVSFNRKMLSVGARLKESLQAKNEDFKARFDESILLSSSSSDYMSSQIKSPTQKLKRQLDFSKKKILNIKTQETDEGSISLKEHQSFLLLDSPINTNSIIQNLQNSRNQSTQKNLPFGTYKKNSEEETTGKKSKPKFYIKKKAEQISLTDKNFDYLIETNSKLTAIIDNLMKSHDSMFNEVKRINEKNELYVQKMSKIQEQFYLIKLNFAQLTNVNNQILTTAKENFKGTYSFRNTLNSLEEKVGQLYKCINQSTRQLKRENSQKKLWMDNFNSNSVKLALHKVTSFGKKTIENEVDHLNPKDQGEFSRESLEYREMPSPSFTYLEDGASYLNEESFKLSHSERSNPSYSRFNYTSTMEDQKSPIYQKNLPMKLSRKQLRFEEEPKIFIKENQLNDSSESNLLSYRSNGTSQFLQVQSARVTSQNEKLIMSRQNDKSIISQENDKSMTSRENDKSITSRENDKSMTSKGNERSVTSRDKMKSENSQIKINFDDLYDDQQGENYKFQRFEIFNYQNQINSSHKNSGNFYKDENITLMKSSFGPIIQKQMSISEKGDSSFGQMNDEVHQVAPNFHQRSINRPRQNSSINIFVSSDSIYKSSKMINNLHHEERLNPTIEYNESSQDSSVRSVCCADCRIKDEKIQRVDIEASQMRKTISELTQQKEKLQKLVKSKIQIIDNLEISLRQVRSLSNLEAPQVSSRPQLFKFNINSQVLRVTSPRKLNQIEDLLPIAKQLSKQVPLQKLESLRQIQRQIQQQLRKQKQLQREFNEKNFRLENNSLDWANGSFSNIDEFRQRSFIKTKAILLKLICMVRDLISEGKQHILK